MNILLVEDESRVADFARRGLKAEGFTVAHCNNGETALTLLADNRFDAILLDIMLPGISGLDVCSRLRQSGDRTPILILSALDRTDQRIAGLRIGADDYLAKPYDFDELVARLQALHRRAGDGDTNDTSLDAKRLSAGTIVLDLISYRVTHGGNEVELTEKERDLLALFLSNPNRVLSRERILNSVWGVDTDPLTNVVDVFVGRLRRKFGFDRHELKNIRGVGYRFDVRDAAASE